MPRPVSRRAFAAAAGVIITGAAVTADDKKDPDRDYPAPQFVPKFAKLQLGKTLVQDFVIFAHSELDMVKKLVEKEPKLVTAAVDWGAGDWETGLGGASHMGRRDIAEFILEVGGRPDLFCAAMLGRLEIVQAFLKLQPKLIDAKGPHGFTLHWHAKAGGKESAGVLDYLQSVKKVDFPAPKKK